MDYGSPSRSSISTGPGLFSLPNELLGRIAFAIAPNGGRRAGNLRLTSQHLAKIVTPLVWSSLHLPASVPDQCAILTVLMWDHDSQASRVESIRYDLPSSTNDAGTVPLFAALLARLPHLRRLHIYGGGKRSNPPPLSQELWSPLGTFPKLATLYLEGLDLKYVGRSAPRLKTLFIERCTGLPGVLGFLGQNSPTAALTLDSLRLVEGVGQGDPAALLFGCLGTAQTVEIHWLTTISAFDDGCFRRLQIWEADTTSPLTVKSLHLDGLPFLFRDVFVNFVTAAVIRRTLQLVGRGPLENLAFPVGTEFFLPPRLRQPHDAMPSVTTLHLLSNTVNSAASPAVDLYSIETHNHLAQLTTTSFPSLTSLHLRGWLNKSIVTVFATASPQLIAGRFPKILCLSATSAGRRSSSSAFESHGPRGRRGRVLLLKGGRRDGRVGVEVGEVPVGKEL